MATEDAIRGYIVTLRKLRDVKQADLAAAVGLQRRAYIDYEMGRTPDLWAAGLLSALRYLGGSFDHLRDLARPSATFTDGREMAEMRLREEAGNELAALSATIGPDEYEAFLEQAQQAAINQSQVFGQVLAMIRGVVRPDDTPPRPHEEP